MKLMKPIDEKLDRLLRAAAKAPPRAVDEIPLGLETRVLAQGRQGGAEDESAFLFVFLRRAVIGACVVLALSVAWTLTRPASDGWGDGASLAQYERQAGLNP